MKKPTKPTNPSAKNLSSRRDLHSTRPPSKQPPRGRSPMTINSDSSSRGAFSSVGRPPSVDRYGYRSDSAVPRSAKPPRPEGSRPRPSSRPRSDESSMVSGYRPRSKSTPKPSSDSRVRMDSRTSSTHRPASKPAARRPSGSPSRAHSRAPHYTPKKRNHPARFFWAVFSVLVLVFLSSYGYKVLTKPRIAETVVEFGSVDAPRFYNGIILRDEKLYTASSEGVIKYAVQDAERVKKGSLVCSIQDPQEVEKIEEKIDNVDKTILNIQAKRENLSIYSAEIKKADGEIKKAVNDGTYLLATNGISSVYFLKDQIAQIMDTRNSFLLNEERGTPKNYVIERKKYESELASAIQNIYSGESGIISYHADGLESALTFSNLYEISKEQIDANPVYEQTGYIRDVKPNDMVFKVIKSNEWYIAAYVDSLEASNWIEGNTKTIYFDDGLDTIPLEVSINKIIPKDDKESYVVFKSTKNMTDFMHLRNIKFNTEPSVTSGLKIPNSAIVEKTLLKIPVNCIFETDNGEVVIKRTEAGDEKIAVYPLDEDENFFYILQTPDGIFFNDTLVIDASKNITKEPTFQVKDIANVKGVYVTNSGSAVFRKISLEGRSSSNEMYTILDSSMNPRLKASDKLVSDAKKIEEKQLMY